MTNQRTATTGTQGSGGSRRNTVLTMILIGLAAVIVLGLVVTTRTPSAPEAAPAPIAGDAIVREDSHQLSTAVDGKVTFVEFLDFECESCGAAYPAIEQLREQYAGRVTFVVRYFPLEGHRNSRQAARAVEAAAQQGKFEAMYDSLFQTQAAWASSKLRRTRSSASTRSTWGWTWRSGTSTTRPPLLSSESRPTSTTAWPSA